LTDRPDMDYSHLDRPEILMGLFHPRPEYESSEKNEHAVDVLIPAEGDIVVGGRFHMGAGKSATTILFFHGNGEIVADYDELGPLYNSMGLNFLPVDYRGYGRSTGTPTVTALMRDCHAVFHFARGWLQENGYKGPFVVMGRSLGSASALELASHYKKQIDGLVVESGFAYTGPLLELLGIDLSGIGFREEEGAGNLEKIKSWNKSTLIIHAELDHLIPFSDAQALFDACASPDKTLVNIPGANHNDIFMRGLDIYMEAVTTLCGMMKKRVD